MRARCRRSSSAVVAGVLAVVGPLWGVAAELAAPRGPGIVPDGARLELLFTRGAPIAGGLTEGPAVAPDGTIYFTDIPLADDRGMILRFDPRTRKTAVFAADRDESHVSYTGFSERMIDTLPSWAVTRAYIDDLGVGECAGEVVSLFGIEVVKAESQAFDAQIALEEGDYAAAEELAYRAMLSAARALVRTEYIDVTEDPDDVVWEFRARFFDTQRFYDRYAGGKFGQYLLDRHTWSGAAPDADVAARRIEESQLFIEAAHACEGRMVAVEMKGAA